MQSFGDHLGTDENVGLADAKIAEDAAEIVFALKRVGVHPLDASVRKEFDQRILDFLCAQAGEADVRVAALLVRADGWHGARVAADMAAELLLLAVIGK